MQKKLHKFELAALANLCPDNAEEAKSLIPRSVVLLYLFIADKFRKYMLQQNTKYFVVELCLLCSVSSLVRA